MNPPIPNDDYELSEVFEKWLTHMTTLESIGADYKLATPFKFAAVRVLMINKVDRFDQIKEQVKGTMPPGLPQEKLQDEMFSATIAKLREYITDKRLESNMARKNADDMDTGGVNDNNNHDHKHDHNHDHDPDHNHDDHPSGHDEWGYPNEVNAFGKAGYYKGYKGGKGGKGKDGKGSGCYKCGEPGHIARDCPHPPNKGQPKGKGKCYNCGEAGHIARNCPYPP